MKILHVDAHKYIHEISVKYTKPSGEKLVIRKGDVFYHFITKKSANYVALVPNPSPADLFRLSDSAMATISDRSKEYKLDADQSSPVTPSDQDAERTFGSNMQYHVLLSRYRTAIIKALTKHLSKYLPANCVVSPINTLDKNRVDGQLGIECKYKGVNYRLTFYLSSNPFFSYSVWVPRRLSMHEADLPKWSQRIVKSIPELQGTLFGKLGLVVNRVNKRKSIVNLPVQGFDGIIYQWTTKV